MERNYNGSNIILFDNATKIHQQFKAKRLGKISKDFSADYMRKTWLNGYVYDFSVNYNAIDISNIIDILKYIMKKHDIKCLG